MLYLHAQAVLFSAEANAVTAVRRPSPQSGYVSSLCALRLRALPRPLSVT